MRPLKTRKSLEDVLSLSNKGFSDGAEHASACIYSLEGCAITDAEISVFKDADPFGFILFQRNCETPDQLRSLVGSLKELVGRDCPVLIDQEGGRVQRLKPPHWREYKPMQFFGELYQESPDEALETLRFETLRLAEELVEVGVNVNCAPVLDLLFDGADEIIGDRAFGSSVDIVSRLGVSVCRHFLSAGITPIIKHIPGHGRAHVDSHLELPVVDVAMAELSATDFEPFRRLATSDVGDAVWAMTAHITYNAISEDDPASLSSKAIDGVIRKDIGFDGVLICDDLDMKALDSYGSVSDKANAALDSGCDLALYCSGEIEKMEELAQNVPKVSREALKRLKKSSNFQNIAA